MSKHLNRDLEALEQDLLTQSSIVEKMILQASQAVMEHRSDCLARLLNDEEQINRGEVRIEEECLKILALHQPVAVDLRRVATVLKINGDLERIADLAVNLAERAQSLVDFSQFRIPGQLEEMVKIALSMVRDALDAFVRQDIDLAHEVCARDDQVDDLNREVIDGLQEILQQQSFDVEPALQYFSASRHIERIADHATNIAEDVIYLVEGEIARHRFENVPADGLE